MLMLIREKKSRKPTRLLKQWSRKSRRIVCSRSDRPNCSPDRHASITHLKNCGKCSGAFLKTWTGMNNRVSMHLHRRSAQTFHLMKYSKIYYWFKSCTGIQVEICSHTESTLFGSFFPLHITVPFKPTYHTNLPGRNVFTKLLIDNTADRHQEAVCGRFRGVIHPQIVLKILAAKQMHKR